MYTVPAVRNFAHFTRLFLLIGIAVLSGRRSFAQIAAWRPLEPQVVAFSSLSFDSVRHVCVLFGGTYGETSNHQTWEWNGQGWAFRHVNGPSSRSSHAMVFDASRGVTVLFGGESYGIMKNDTWEWDGNVWRCAQVTGPSPRTGHAMVYDSSLHRVVLFGGTTATGLSGETWSYDGTAWTLVSTQGPAARAMHAMAFDSDRNVIVLTAGNAGIPMNDTWEFAWGSWTLREASNSRLTPRSEHAMAYDPVRHVTVLCGGKVNNAYTGHTFEWDGSAWTQRTTFPFSRQPALTYDASRSRMVLYAGQIAERGDQGWMVLTNYPSQSGSIAFDADRQMATLLDINGLSEWNGGAWVSRPASGLGISPGPMVFDILHHRLFLFAGGQSWELQSGVWTRRIVPGPSTRSDHRMVYDSTRNVTVLFGGADLGDTWEWDGSAWTQRLVSGPPPRKHHAMAYDSFRHVVVLFGGMNQSQGQVFSDTWEWDGTAWSQRLVAGPPATWGHSMAFDSGARTCILFGGGTSGNQTWDFDGTAWTQRQTSTTDSNRLLGASLGLAYDSIHSRMILRQASPGAPTRELSLCSPPAISSQPESRVVCPGSSVSFSVVATGSGVITYEWLKDNHLISDNPSALTSQLTLSTVSPADVGSYRCNVEDECQFVYSSIAVLTICAANFNCDSAVDFFDYLDFVQAFASLDASADFNNDSVINFTDYLDFVQAFSGGC